MSHRTLPLTPAEQDRAERRHELKPRGEGRTICIPCVHGQHPVCEGEWCCCVCGDLLDQKAGAKC